MLTKGTGVITTKGIAINTYCELNSKKLQFTDFFITADGDPRTYGDMTSPAGFFNNVLNQEITHAGHAKELQDLVYTSTVYTNGDYLPTNVATIVPISLNIPANGIVTEEDLKNIYVIAKDPEIELILQVASVAGWVEGDNVFKTTDVATHGVISRIYTNSLGEKLFFLKAVTAGFVDGDNIDDGGVKSTSITQVRGETVLSIVSTAYTVGETVTGAISGATGVIYSKPAGKLILKDVIGTFQAEDVTGNVSGNTVTAAAVTFEDIGFVYYTGFFRYDTVGPTTSTKKFIPGSSDINCRINLRRTSGVPTELDFKDTRVVEIYQHNNLATAHNLRTTGNLSYVYNTDFTTVDELQALIYSLPFFIDHDVTITGFDGAIIMSLGSSPLIIGKSPVAGFNGSGTLTFDTFDNIAEAQVLGGNCYTVLDTLYFIAGYATTAISATNSVVKAIGCAFDDTNLDYCGVADGKNAYIEFYSCTIGADAPVSVGAATNGGTIVSDSWVNPFDNPVQNVVWSVYDGGVIYKKGSNQPISVRTVYPIYEKIVSSGQIHGIFGIGANYTSSTFTFTFGATDTAEIINQKIEMLGKFIPVGCTLTLKFPDTAGTTTTTTAIDISGFYGGGYLILLGDDYNIGYNEDVDDDITSRYNTAGVGMIIKNNSVDITVKGIEIAVTDDNVCFSIANCNKVDFWYNKIVCNTAISTVTHLIEILNANCKFYYNIIGKLGANSAGGAIVTGGCNCNFYNNKSGIDFDDVDLAVEAFNVTEGAVVCSDGDQIVAGGITHLNTTTAGLGVGVIRTASNIIQNDATIV